MQSYRCTQINRMLKASGYYDLKAVKESDGNPIRLMRKVTVPVSVKYKNNSYVYLKDSYQWIVSLTDNWQESGNPVEWGLEPIMRKVLEMDAWRDDSFYQRLVERREDDKRIRERSHKNEVRAIAADMRKDFAREVDDINTSTINKIDHRRKKDAYSK